MWISTIGSSIEQNTLQCKKIAFLFLVREMRVVKDKIWSKFFDNVDTSLYNIYCHSKYWFNESQLNNNFTTMEPNFLENKCIIIDTHIDTEWADISIMHYLNLHMILITINLF